MKHVHTGHPTNHACEGCFAEVKGELRARRIWAWVIVGFSFALAMVSAFVLWKVGMGR